MNILYGFAEPVAQLFFAEIRQRTLPARTSATVIDVTAFFSSAVTRQLSYAQCSRPRNAKSTTSR